MNRVRVELWLLSGKETGENSGAVSPAKSTLDVEVDEGTPLTMLFKDLADSYQAIREKVFNRDSHLFYPNIILTLNDRVVHCPEVSQAALRDGDIIAVLPMYVGG